MQTLPMFPLVFARNALVYLTYSDRLIDGFPDNAITAVSILDQKIPLR